MTEPDLEASDPGPELPQPGPSRLAIGYGIFGGVVLALYMLAGVMGWHFFEPDRNELPSSVRHSPGGYRSYAFWHSGYQGGK